MRILMLTTNSSLMDGINRHVLAVAEGVNKIDGFEVAVCTVYPDGDLNSELQRRNVKTYALNAKSGHDVRVFGEFLKVIKEFKPTIVHVHVLALMERLALSWFLHGIKLVQTVHGVADPVKQVTFKQRLEKCLARLSPLSGVRNVYISEGVRKHLRGRGAVIYNPIEVQMAAKRHKLHEALNISEDTQIIGTACRFAAVKQPNVFVEVMCRVLETLPSVHAALIGDGDDEIKAQMRDVASHFDIAGRVHWLGYRADAPELIGDFSMFVMTSKREGMPTALLEAMSHGTPVAFLKGEGGLIDLVGLDRQHGGIAIVGENALDLAQKIVKHVENAAVLNAMTERALHVVKQHFSVEVVARQLSDFYRSIVFGGNNDSV